MKVIYALEPNAPLILHWEGVMQQSHPSAGE
jgi:hypothetical protein